MDIDWGDCHMGALSYWRSGCELFLVNTRNDSPQKIVFYEIYLDQEAFDQHGTYVHTQQFFEIVKGKIENAKPEVIFLTTLAS